MSKKPSSNAAIMRSEPAPWSGIVLVCSKCMRRRDREDLRGDLRKALKQAGRKDVRVVASGCLDLCPDDGVTVARGGDLGGAAPRLQVVPTGASSESLVGWMLGEGGD